MAGRPKRKRVLVELEKRGGEDYLKQYLLSGGTILKLAKDLDLESRRRVFKALLLKYHPDMNPGNGAVSSITFQFVMKQKEWFSVAA